MTKRDFFRIIIKIFGLYSMILALFKFLPQNISNILMFNEDLLFIFVIIISSFLMIFLFLIIIFKTDLIIDLLKLDRGFDEEHLIIGDFKTEQILKFALIIISLFLIVDYTPSLIFEIVNTFNIKVSSNVLLDTKINYFNLSISFVNVVLGYLILTNCKRVASFLNKKV